MKRLAFIGFLLIAALLVVGRYAAQSRLVGQLDERYLQARRGMNSGEVAMLMNRSTFEMLDKQSGEDLSGWWDNKPLEVQESARIQSAIRYTALGPFRTVRFVFMFDDKDKLVGKRRFD